MTGLIRGWILIGALGAALSLPACATVAPKPPPGITAEATRSFYAMYAIKDADYVRDFVANGHNATPPMFSAKTALAVVNWHETTVDVIHAAKTGWREAALQGIDDLKKVLPPDDYARAKPYLDLAKIGIQEIP